MSRVNLKVRERKIVLLHGILYAVTIEVETGSLPNQLAAYADISVS
jgi:hypothetical protein